MYLLPTTLPGTWIISTVWNWGATTGPQVGSSDKREETLTEPNDLEMSFETIDPLDKKRLELEIEIANRPAVKQRIQEEAEEAEKAKKKNGRM